MTGNVLLAQLVNNFSPFLGNRSYIESPINLVKLAQNISLIFIQIFFALTFSM